MSDPPSDRAQPAPDDGRCLARPATQGDRARIPAGGPLEDDLDLDDAELLVAARVLRRMANDTPEPVGRYLWYNDMSSPRGGMPAHLGRALRHADCNAADCATTTPGCRSRSYRDVTRDLVLAVHPSLPHDRWLVAPVAASPGEPDDLERAVHAHGAHLSGGGVLTVAGAGAPISEAGFVDVWDRDLGEQVVMLGRRP